MGLTLSLVLGTAMACAGRVGSVPDGQLVTKDAANIIVELSDAKDTSASVEKSYQYRGNPDSIPLSEAYITIKDDDETRPWFASCWVYVYRDLATARSEYAKRVADMKGVSFPGAGDESTLAQPNITITDLVFRENNVLVVVHSQGDPLTTPGNRAQSWARLMASRIP